MSKSSKSNGFTLVELLIAMAITGIVAGAIFTAFQSQQKSYLIQDQVAEMQQNLRAGMDIMVREIRMAGYNPNRSGNFTILSASATSMKFTADLNPHNNPNGAVDSGDTFLYQLYDSDSDGENDALRRTPNGSAVANNIYNIEFYYTLANGTNATAPANPSEIRSVQITILAKTEHKDPKFTNTKTYYTTPLGVDWGPYNDNFRRRLLSTTVRCRNMGL